MISRIIKGQAKTLLLAVASLSLILSSCYKEDANVLYSRQYVLAGEFKGLNDKINEINELIGSFKQLKDSLDKNAPVTSLEYNVRDNNGVKDTLGATFTFNTTKVYIPFGKNGNTPVATISDKGTWVINGKDTNKPSKGNDGKNPVIGAKQDPNNTADENFYWTVKFGDEEPTFILDERGQKIRANGLKGEKGDNGADGKNGVDGRDGTNGRDGVDGKDGTDGRDGRDGRDGVDGKDGKQGPEGKQGPQGLRGLPGENSPITGAKLSDDGTYITVTTTVPGLESVKLPIYKQLKFIIKPLETKLKDSIVADRYDETHNVLMFNSPDEELAIPFEKDDDLVSMSANVPFGWKYRIDTDTKTLYIKSPDISNLGNSATSGDFTVFAREENGNSYSRSVKVYIANKLFINYFFNDNEKHIIEGSPLSPFNEFSITSLDKVAHFISAFRYDETQKKVVRYLNYLKKDETASDVAEAEKKLRKVDAITVDINPNENYPQFVTWLDYVYHPDVYDIRLIGQDENDPSKFYIYTKLMKNITKGNTWWITPSLPWDTYSLNAQIKVENKSKVETLRFRRLLQKVVVKIKNPRKMLGLDESTPLDADKFRMKHPATVGMTTEGYFLNRYSGSENNIKYSLATIDNATSPNSITYNAEEDLLEAEFNSFPTGNTDLVRLMVEYETADGVKRKVLEPLNKNFQVPEGGCILTYRYGIRIPELQGVDHSFVLRNLRTSNSNYRQLLESNIRDPKSDENWEDAIYPQN